MLGITRVGYKIIHIEAVMAIDVVHALVAPERVYLGVWKQIRAAMRRASMRSGPPAISNMMGGSSRLIVPLSLRAKMDAGQSENRPHPSRASST